MIHLEGLDRRRRPAVWGSVKVRHQFDDLVRCCLRVKVELEPGAHGPNVSGRAPQVAVIKLPLYRWRSCPPHNTTTKPRTGIVIVSASALSGLLTVSGALSQVVPAACVGLDGTPRGQRRGRRGRADCISDFGRSVISVLLARARIWPGRATTAPNPGSPRSAATDASSNASRIRLLSSVTARFSRAARY